MKIIIASNNKGKIKEMSEILEPIGFEVFSQAQAGFSLDVEEIAKTFDENTT